MRSTRWILVVGFLLASASAALAQDLRTVPTDHWSYAVADALVLRHPPLSETVWLAHRPWRVQEFRELVERAKELNLDAVGSTTGRWVEMLAEEYSEPVRDPGDRTVRVYNEVSPRVRGFLRTDEATFEPAFLSPRFEDEDGAPELRGIVEHTGAIEHREGFAFVWRYAIDSDVRNDPSRTRIGRFRDLGGSDEEAGAAVLDAYGTYRWGALQVTGGRASLALGPGRGSSVFLSDSAPAIDQLKLELHSGPVRFTGMIGRLSEDPQNRTLDEDGRTRVGTMPPETGRVDVIRNLYLHRFELRLSHIAQVALTEAAVVAGIDRGFEARYANMIIPFVLTQEDEDEPGEPNVNVVADVQGVFTAIPNVQLYGDWFAQTFFLLDPDKREEFGNQFAWRAGVKWARPFGLARTEVGAEYTRADVFMYLHRGLNTNWATFGVPLGSTLGPDADQGVAWLDHWIDPTLRLTFEALARREGVRDIETLESFLDAGNPDFPSGVVQNQWRLGAEAWKIVPGLGLEGRLRAGWRTVEDIANEPGRDDEFWELEFGLTYRGDWSMR